jgi:predicted glycosyltransferase
MTRRVFFYVQHLLGIGHLRRATTLARALDDAGLEVTLVSGGSPIPGLDLGGGRLVQLPSVRAVDLYFKVLVDENDQPVDDAWKARRADALMSAWREVEPHVLMFELFPFGRRQMRFEILPLLEAAGVAEHRPLIVSSVRDILVGQHKPERNDEMIALVNRYFDRVMIHGDPDLIAFDRTFPHARQLGDKASYTGYVVDTSGRASENGPGGNEIIVSAGGGAVGDELLRCAMQARARTKAADRIWRVLVGYTVPEADFRALAEAAPEGVIVERARPDFTELLANCDLSISQGGYNTVMECLHAKARTIVVPYAGGIETEQTLRARLLAEHGVLHIVNEADLSPAVLARAVDSALDGPPASTDIDTGGGPAAAKLITAWAEKLPWA